ncbi:UDP kinase [Dolosigranulum pigrum]|jgi:diacylglycerol kinase|uniref:UDP kinase n=1 Tax=Dolosigranulum pigrum TaxID=29394 RepID=A0A328KPX9_9LACT|nr:diacylglycerol kinase family protein [Dolosigranulum pigrum]QJS96512.1 diacylglycerol kinase family protein [Dolosigranulum pigrum]QTJ32846.1 diacylglycerol kinase family protein [Dolosigranulum pigrum]QTJ44344.1 diacylglycerol kinase family protein [Dolosigranulum pigrum]RAN58264.1 UDP kinase [Dolosigranulum pigrum]RAN63110.1 UDP kinase [Dolosigranulum pigrum]
MNQPRPEKNKTFKRSAHFAWEGVKTAYREERNFRFHISMTVIVFLGSLAFDFSPSDYKWLLVAIFVVIASEILNTIIENLVDLVIDEYHPLAKKVKDMSAGIVLISAVFSFIIGLLLFVPKIMTYF